MEFTKEQLIARAETVLSNARTAADFHDSKPYHLMDVHLAEIALASLTTEAVGEVVGVGPWLMASFYGSVNPGCELYTAAPVPVVPVEVMDALQKVARIRLDLNDFDGDRRGIADCLGEAEEELVEVANRCAAMLQGGNNAD